jgi:predicted O-methyltransferase YrrM
VSLRAKLPDYNTDILRIESKLAEQVVGDLGMDVPCAMGWAQRRMLYQVVRAMGAKTVLDIGTYCGSSAATFAQAVGEGGRVVSVDIRDANSPNAYWSRVPGCRPPIEALESVGLADRVRFVKARSDEFMSKTSERFDFISIDGWHEAFAVYTDVLLALNLLNPDGLIFMDDVQRPGQPIPPGVNKIPGPHKALVWHENRETPFRVHFTEEAPAAFLLAPSP